MIVKFSAFKWPDVLNLSMLVFSAFNSCADFNWIMSANRLHIGMIDTNQSLCHSSIRELKLSLHLKWKSGLYQADQIRNPSTVHDFRDEELWEW